GGVTQLTLRTHALPEFFGIVNATIKASTDAALRRLIDRVVSFYEEHLYNPHWGEQIVFRPDNTIVIRMMFQGIDQDQAESIWRPFLDWVASAPSDFTVTSTPVIAALPARKLWD